MNLSTSNSKSSRRLFRDLVIFSVLAVMLYTGLCYFFYARPQFLVGERGWIELHRRLVRSEQPFPGKTVYLGDSVGAQFFPYQHNRNSVTANGAVLMAGQFVLAGKVSEHEGVERIVIAITPESLMRPFEHDMTFGNFVKPFYAEANAAYILPSTHEKVAGHRWGTLSKHVPLKFLPFSDVDYSIFHHESFPFDLGCADIVHLLKLMDRRGKEVVFICPPVSKSRFSRQDGYKLHREVLDAAGLGDAFNDYFDQIIVLEDEAFVDEMHLKPEGLPELKEWMQALLEPPSE